MFGLVTKKQLKKRFDKHLVDTHGFVPSDLGACRVSGSLTIERLDAEGEWSRNTRDKLEALLDYLKLEVKNTDPVPGGVKIVKK